MVVHGNGTRRSVSLSTQLGRKAGSAPLSAGERRRGEPAEPVSDSACSISKLIFAVFCSIAEQAQYFSFDKLTASAPNLSRPFRPRGRSERRTQLKVHQPLCLRVHIASGQRFAFLSQNADDTEPVQVQSPIQTGPIGRFAATGSRPTTAVCPLVFTPGSA
jgi:hypothetical protein